MRIKKILKKYNKIPIEVKASVVYTICNVLQRCISLITVPLFTNMLTQTEYGQSTLYSSWSGIITIFITLNLAYGSFSTAMVKYEDKRFEYISSVQGIILVLSGCFLLLYLPFHKIWNKLLFHLPTYIVVIAVFDIIATAAIQLWSGKKRFEYKYISIVTVTLIISVLSPILGIILVKNVEHDKGYARIIGIVSVNIIVGLIIFLNNWIKGKHLYNKEFWEYAFGFNVPLIAYYVSQTIFNVSDRIMIEHIEGTDKAALYGIAYTIATILIFVLNAINNSYTPWYYSKIKSGNQKDNKSISCAISVLMALMLLCVIWYAPEIILLLSNSSYLEAMGVVPPVAMSVLLLFYAQLFINVQFYYEEKKSLVSASIGAALINIILNALLIPRFGFVAAGYTTLFSYLVFAVSNYYAVKKTLKKHNITENGYDIPKLIIIFVLFMVSSFIGELLYNYLLIRIVITVIVLVVVVIFRKKLINAIMEIRKK